ncbi:MAG: hypothetical protein WAM70_14355, partial [Pyrinomonadaceae bacterium]
TAEVTDIKVENVTDPVKPFTYSYHVRVPGYAQRTGKRMFFQPGYFSHGAGSLFTSASRKHDVYFNYPWAEHELITIDLPEGFALDNADTPQPITPEMTKQLSEQRIKIGVTTDGRMLRYERQFFFGGGGSILFPVASYPAIRQLFDVMAKSNDHTLTLKQIGAN